MTTGFTVPNRPDTSWTDQAEPDAVDFQALVGDLYGVTSGCAVTQQASPTYTVVVAAGRGVCSGVPVTVPGGNVSLANPSANPRFDLIVFNSAGVSSAVTGTADPNPRFPTLPDGFTLIAVVYCPAGALNYANANIVDKRKFLNEGFRRIVSTATTLFLSSRIAGATSDAFQVTGDGKMTWAGGLNLRANASLLTVNSGGVAIEGGGTLVVGNVAGATSQMVSGNVTADQNVTATGLLQGSNFRRGSGAPTTGNAPGAVLGDLYVDATVGNLWQYKLFNSTPTWVLV